MVSRWEVEANTKRCENNSVKFDVVVLVGISKEMFVVNYGDEFIDLSQEKKRTNRDLLYVALTRAIQELHILGSVQLSSVINW